MTGEDRRDGKLEVLPAKQTVDARQPINAVYCRNTALSSRIRSFVDYLFEAMKTMGFSR